MLLFSNYDYLFSQTFQGKCLVARYSHSNAWELGSTHALAIGPQLQLHSKITWKYKYGFKK